MLAESLWSRIQARAWPWVTLLCILAVEQALDFATTVFAIPLGAHESNPAMWLLYAEGGAPALLIAKGVCVLILTLLTLHFVRTPKARLGPYALLALMSSFWTALFYAWLLLGNALQLSLYIHP
jgi:fumarate reductase subunit D